MPSEIDPLLPKSNSAPEITGYGFTKGSESSRSRESSPEQQHRRPLGLDKEAKDQISGGPSPLRTMLMIFMIVVGLALVITLSIPGVVKPVLNRPNNNSSPSISSRVDSILADTPLIGLLVFPVCIQKRL